MPTSVTRTLVLSVPLALAVCLAAFSFSAATARGEEWTRFRGPNGQGQCDTADSIPVEWTDDDYNWKVKLPGKGSSSPVVWGERIFLTSGDAETGKRSVFCLSTRDGKKLWQRDYEAGTHHVHKFNSYASGTPALDAERVYVAWATPDEVTLLALSHGGDEVWRKNLGPFKSEHGFGTSPIVVDGMVILTNDHEGEDRFVIAVDAATGEQRWRIERGFADNWQNASYSTPCIRETAAGRELILCSWAHGISSHDIQTGKTNWETKVFDLRPVASPVLFGDLIIANCGDGGGKNTVVAVRPSDKPGQPPETVYTKSRSISPYVPSICAAGELIFLWNDRGIVSCLDAASGKVHWTKRVGGNFFGSPVRVGDRLYAISTDGDVNVLAASKEFNLLAKNSLGEGSRATPAIADGRMYLRTDSQLFSLGGERAASGRQQAAGGGLGDAR